MSTGSHDKALLVRLLQPLVSVIEESIRASDAGSSTIMRGRPIAVTVLRAGVILERVGQWLLLRECSQTKTSFMVAEVVRECVADSEAITEMISSADIGAPFPSIG